MADNPAISVTDLRKTYLDFWRRPAHEALRGVSFSVPRGGVFSLIGPNGSGKSTAIKIILGLVSPSSGQVSVFGAPPGSLSARRRTGYLPEITNLHRFLTPRETLHYYAGIFGLDARTTRERTRQLLDMVGLADAADREIGQFSKGMARRVGIAQALINNPDLVVFDEPTSGLDPLGAIAVKHWIVRLAAAGKTVFMSSHILSDVEEASTQVVFLCDGVLKASGDMETLLPGRRESHAAKLESLFLDVVDREAAPPLAPFLLEDA